MDYYSVKQGKILVKITINTRKEDKMKWKYTNVQHLPRIELGLNLNEYCVFDIVYQSQTHPSYQENGWAKTGCHKIAQFLGLSSGTVKNIFDRGEELGFLEFGENRKYKKTTALWYDNAYLDNEGSVQKMNVQKLNTKRSEIEHLPVQKLNTKRSEIEPIIKESKYLNKNKEKESVSLSSESNDSLDVDNESNDVNPTSLEAEKEITPPYSAPAPPKENEAADDSEPDFTMITEEQLQQMGAVGNVKYRIYQLEPNWIWDEDDNKYCKAIWQHFAKMHQQLRKRGELLATHQKKYQSVQVGRLFTFLPKWVRTNKLSLRYISDNLNEIWTQVKAEAAAAKLAAQNGEEAQVVYKRPKYFKADYAETA